MKEIKLFKASNFSYTPFNDYVKGDLEFLNNHKIYITDNINEADIIISQNLKHLKKYFWRFLLGHKFLIWTLEPRFDISFEPLKKMFYGIIKCHIMNIYTKDVFVTNISIHANLIKYKLSLVNNNFEFKNRKIIALMSYFKGVDAPKLIRDGKNIDLVALRSSIAIEGYKRGILDVYGKGWPEGISIEDSRKGDWRLRKRELMQDYSFNLCFENTIAQNYMTEKIWESIDNYCLPIYYGEGTNAYEIFPQDSFIDYSKFNNHVDLFDYISKMTDTEYVKRMNLCIEVYNSLSCKNPALAIDQRKIVLEEILKKIHNIIDKK